MIVNAQTVNDLFASGGDVRYVLPHFQREYAWEKIHWQHLFDDVKEVYDAPSDSRQPHFMGALVVIQEVRTAGTMSQYTLVDGQQRLTTISLLLCALRDFMDVDSPRRAEIEKLLVNPGQDGDKYFKIKPTIKYDDLPAYFKIIDGERKVRYESGIVKAWKYFQKLLSEHVDIDVERFYECIVNYMQVVFIKLDRNEKPFKIFESLNAKGKPLSQADLVRNYIAMKLPPDDQLVVFRKFWVPIDNMLRERRKVARFGELTAFLRHYLAMTDGVLANKDQVYTRFRNYMENNFREPDKFIGELERIHRFAEYYDKLLRPEREEVGGIQQGIKRINIIAESVSYPLLLRFYDLYSSEVISAVEFVNALGVVENFAVRFFLAGLPSSSLTRLFPVLPTELECDDFLPSLTSALLAKNYPSDVRIRQSFPISFRYTSQTRHKLILVLLTIDRHLARDAGGYPVLDGPPTIEHIMPQTIRQSKAWQEELGSEWLADHDDYLDNVGNLTLVTQEWNTELSNGSFAAKRDKLAKHALLINSQFFVREIPHWNTNAISLRASWLTDLALEVWHALGGFDSPSSIRGSTPTLLAIEGQTYEVSRWRDVLVCTVEVLLPRLANFESVANRFASNISSMNSGFLTSHQLQNGFWLKTNLSESAIYSFCKRFADAAGLGESQWRVEYE